jgi:hypothetical protein
MIIESGPRHSQREHADRESRRIVLGLAQLYQLRGRVGRREAAGVRVLPRAADRFRSHPAADETLRGDGGIRGARERLPLGNARPRNSRGAATCLASSSTATWPAVGFELYTRMLKETVDELRGSQRTESPPCASRRRTAASIPDRYVPDADERMLIYKRIAHMAEPEQVKPARRRASKTASASCRDRRRTWSTWPGSSSRPAARYPDGAHAGYSGDTRAQSDREGRGVVLKRGRGASRRGNAGICAWPCPHSPRHVPAFRKLSGGESCLSPGRHSR